MARDSIIELIKFALDTLSSNPNDQQLISLRKLQGRANNLRVYIYITLDTIEAVARLVRKEEGTVTIAELDGVISQLESDAVKRGELVS